MGTASLCLAARRLVLLMDVFYSLEFYKFSCVVYVFVGLVLLP